MRYLQLQASVCYKQTLNGTDAFTLVFGVKLVCVAMTTAEGEGHTAANVVIVVPSGDWDTAWTWVHRHGAYTCTSTTDQYQLAMLDENIIDVKTICLNLSLY